MYSVVHTLIFHFIIKDISKPLEGGKISFKKTVKYYKSFNLINHHLNFHRLTESGESVITCVKLYVSGRQSYRPYCNLFLSAFQPQLF